MLEEAAESTVLEILFASTRQNISLRRHQLIVCKVTTSHRRIRQAKLRHVSAMATWEEVEEQELRLRSGAFFICSAYGRVCAHERSDWL
jgi:hypothetical protein